MDERSALGRRRSGAVAPGSAASALLYNRGDGGQPSVHSCQFTPQTLTTGSRKPMADAPPGEVSELADERDLGSRAERRGSSSLPFPTPASVC